jgi:alkaline phosphatase
MTDPAETLIIVTSDHGHAMTFAGYPKRGNPIMGLVHGPSESLPNGRLALDDDGLPYTTLGYVNGPGYRVTGPPDFTLIDPAGSEYRQEALRPLSSSSHSGEDVPVYASGPGSQVVAGVMEQNVIFHLMVQASPLLTSMAEAMKSDQGRPDWAAFDPQAVPWVIPNWPETFAPVQSQQR